MAGYGALRQDDEMPAFPPPVIYSNASANYARLCLLVVDVGTPAVAKKVLENLPKNCATLAEALELEQKYRQIESLRARNIISDSQFEQLYPSSVIPVDVEKIDLGLWVVLLRHVTANSKNINKKWQENPQHWHQKYFHDIQRLKLLRNKLAHPGIKAALGEEKFREMWREAEYSLLRLGVEESTIRSYLEGNIDPEKAGVAVQQVTGQYVTEFNSLLKRTKLGNRRQNVLFGIIGSIIIVLIIAVVVIVLTIKKPFESCANNIEYVADYAMVGYLTREGWGGRKPGPMDPLHHPVDYVVISHTAQITTPCTTTDDCCATVRRLQKINMQKWSDIAYNYLIGDTGIVFIGRGPNYVSATAQGWNTRILGFGFIGIFVEKRPTWRAVSALDNYLQYLVGTNVLASNYTMYGLCQVRSKFPDAPGAAFMRVLKKKFPGHWHPYQMENCNMTPRVGLPFVP